MKLTVRSTLGISYLLGAFLLSGCGGSSPQMKPPPLPLKIITTSLPNATAETSYSEPVLATGGTAPFTWTVSAGALPNSMALDGSTSSTLTITGNPEPTTQDSAFTIKVSDSGGQSTTQPYTISVVTGHPSLTGLCVTAVGTDCIQGGGGLSCDPGSPPASPGNYCASGTQADFATSCSTSVGPGHCAVR